MEDLANILTAIHANKATDSNKDQKKQTSETAAIKRNEKNKSENQAWNQIERRQNKDRRKVKVNRGRWLDS